MTPTLISRRGYILNSAEGAIVYLNRMLNRDDLSPFQRFQITNNHAMLADSYAAAQDDDISLSFLETEILFLRQEGILQAM